MGRAAAVTGCGDPRPPGRPLASPRALLSFDPKNDSRRSRDIQKNRETLLILHSAAPRETITRVSVFPVCPSQTLPVIVGGKRPGALRGRPPGAQTRGASHPHSLLSCGCGHTRAHTTHTHTPCMRAHTCTSGEHVCTRGARTRTHVYFLLDMSPPLKTRVAVLGITP